MCVEGQLKAHKWSRPASDVALAGSEWVAPCGDWRTTKGPGRVTLLHAPTLPMYLVEPTYPALPIGHCHLEAPCVKPLPFFILSFLSQFWNLLSRLTCDTTSNVLANKTRKGDKDRLGCLERGTLADCYSSRTLADASGTLADWQPSVGNCRLQWRTTATAVQWRANRQSLTLQSHCSM